MGIGDSVELNVSEKRSGHNLIHYLTIWNLSEYNVQIF